MLLTELKEHSFEKEKEGAIEITYDLVYSFELKYHILKSTGKPLNEKYYLADDKEIHYYKNGKIHREDNLPAVIGKNGSLFYYVNDKPHRIDGPALIQPNGDYYWYMNGYEIDKECMNKWLEENNIPLDWNAWSDNDKMLFALHWSDYNG